MYSIEIKNETVEGAIMEVNKSLFLTVNSEDISPDGILEDAGYDINSVEIGERDDNVAEWSGYKFAYEILF